MHRLISTDTPHHSTSRHRGFSLVELLVVIAIIAVLLGLLLPALSGARNSAREAATRALMTAVDSGIKSYRTEKGRLPGAFSADELANFANNNDDPSNPNITAMENALLELLGGVVPTEPTTGTGFSITLGQSAHQVWIEPGLIGAKDGPAFLSIGNALKAAAEQFGQNAGRVNRPLPDVMDSFGQPIAMWTRNEYAGRNADFAGRYHNPALPAQFYWGANASYMNSQLLGVGQVNQKGRSLLSENVPVTELIKSITAICGNPAFPNQSGTAIDASTFGPAAARGDVVLHSAGVDQYFMDRGLGEDGQISDLQSARYLGGRIPSDLGLNSSVNNWATIDFFDDIIVGGG